MNYEIDFKSPALKLADVMYDVKLQGVYSDFKFPDTLFKVPVCTPGHRAVVNQSNGEIVSIVGKNYQLISNKAALELGKQIFIQLYPSINLDELIPFKVVTPQSLASVHIDLIHKDVNFNVWEQETWLPFLRTTNSYNRSVALSFEIGFVRKLCSNGVLFNKQSIKLKYLHNKGNIIDAVNVANQIKTTSELFSNQCKTLNNYPISKELIFAFVCKIMNINLELPANNQISKKITLLENLYDLTEVLTDRYAQEMGINAYTVFNVVSDLVSHQDEYKNLTGYNFNVRSYYSKPTDWMLDFSSKTKMDNFIYTDYLKDTIDRLERIKQETNFEWELN